MESELAFNCRHYLGDRPCKFKCACRCEHFEPMGCRILIIKLVRWETSCGRRVCCRRCEDSIHRRMSRGSRSRRECGCWPGIH